MMIAESFASVVLAQVTGDHHGRDDQRQADRFEGL